ncbi:MAG: DNA cytosine methyltransferase [Vicinamibacterales bacterium]
MTPPRPFRVLELFCGIGGCAAAVAGEATVVGAVDQNRHALRAYAANFGHPVHPLAIETVPRATWFRWDADLWWLSPPCRPFTTRGRQRDLDDPRARGLLAVIDALEAVRPPAVAVENVPGFQGSRAHARLGSVLRQAGYDVRETLLCPTELGVPNRRRRFYLVARRGGLADWPARTAVPVALASLLDATPGPELLCEPDLERRFARALSVVDPADPAACAACFTSAYGRSIVRSGSYLATPAGVRRFSPDEILRLLDFPAGYRLPSELPLGTAWRLVGDSVSVRAVRWVLSAVLPAPDAGSAWARWTTTAGPVPILGSGPPRRT